MVEFVAIGVTTVAVLAVGAILLATEMMWLLGHPLIQPQFRARANPLHQVASLRNWRQSRKTLADAESGDYRGRVARSQIQR
jgi:hypothetical protein